MPDHEYSLVVIELIGRAWGLEKDIEKGDVYPLSKSHANTIGRAASEATICIVQNIIGPWHSEILWEPANNKFRIKKIRARFGPFVNGAEVEDRLLEVGDEIQIGFVVLQLR